MQRRNYYDVTPSSASPQKAWALDQCHCYHNSINSVQKMPKNTGNLLAIYLPLVRSAFP
jgi:hypothetical protein